MLYRQIYVVIVLLLEKKMELAEFYLKKSLTDRKLNVMQEILLCEGAISAAEFSITTCNGCISFARPSNLSASSK